MSLLSMSDGVDATYSKGSFLVYHKGVAYVNYDAKTCKPIIFADNAVGDLIAPGLIEVEGQFNHKHILPEAKTMKVKMENGDDASYLEGGYELVYNGDTYFLMDDKPIFSTKSSKDLRGFLKGTTTLQIPFIIGLRGKAVHTFEKKSELSSKKRKRSDEKSEKAYELVKQRAGIIQKNAPNVLKLARKALGSVKELIAAEEAACRGVNVGGRMFEDPMHPLRDAVAAISCVICSAKGKEPRFGFEVSDDDEHDNE